jgi:16S rRNA (guanine966-N2)-methyltransferase
MDTRRPTNSTNKTYSRKPYPRKEGERSFGDRKFQPRDNRFQPRGGGDRFQDRDNRFKERDNRFPDRDNRFQDRDSRFQKRDGKFSPRNDRFQGKRRFPPKGKPLKPWQKDNRPRLVSDLQVSDGKHRGKYLQTSNIPSITMTPRRVRELLFKALYRRIRAGRFLDLCAGTGAVGIEAISRGAMVSTFVERSARMCSLIKKNLEACGIKTGHGEVVETEVVPFLKQMANRRRFWDVVYFNPPSDSNTEEILKYFSRGAGIKPHGILVIEHHSDTFFPERIGVMKRWRVIVQGETTLSFYDRK